MIGKKTNILVTGGSGFLGGHLLRELSAQGYKNVHAPSSKELDLLSSTSINNYFKANSEWIQKACVIHLAATCGGIGANRNSPGTFFYNNMKMGLELIEACKNANTKKFILMGTTCSYPKFTPVPFKEEDIWNGYPEETNAPYGVAKKALMVQVQAYRQQYNFNGIILLPSNMYGTDDDLNLENNHVIPALIKKVVDAHNNEEATVPLWGDGSASREFFYVKDCARAIVRAMEVYDGGEPINLGTGKEITIAALFKLIVKLVTGDDNSIKPEWDTTKPNGQPRRCLDVSRMNNLLQFTPEYDLEDGLRETIEWYESLLFKNI